MHLTRRASQRLSRPLGLSVQGSTLRDTAELIKSRSGLNDAEGLAAAEAFRLRPGAYILTCKLTVPQPSCRVERSGFDLTRRGGIGQIPERFEGWLGRG